VLGELARPAIEPVDEHRVGAQIDHQDQARWDREHLVRVRALGASRFGPRAGVATSSVDSPMRPSPKMRFTPTVASHSWR